MSVDDTADFSKQRRNLIIISGVLLLHDFLGINYENFEVFGMEIAHDEKVTWILWIMWLYFFIRYFNFFSEKKHTLFLPVKHIYYSYHKRTIKKHIEKDGTQVRKIELIKTKNLLDIKYKVFYDESYETIVDRSDFDTDLSKKKLLVFSLFAFLNYIFKTHYFFEYYFPIIFAFVPLIMNLGVLASWR